MSRASFAVHHGPVGLAARPNGLTSSGSRIDVPSERSSATSRRTAKAFGLPEARLLAPTAIAATPASASSATTATRRRRILRGRRYRQGGRLLEAGLDVDHASLVGAL